MREQDQDKASALAEITAEWQRLDQQRRALEAEFAEWKDELLASADRIGLGQAIRRRARPPDDQE